MKRVCPLILTSCWYLWSSKTGTASRTFLKLTILRYEDDADFTNTFRALGSIPAVSSEFCCVPSEVQHSWLVMNDGFAAPDNDHAAFFAGWPSASSVALLLHCREALLPMKQRRSYHKAWLGPLGPKSCQKSVRPLGCSGWELIKPALCAVPIAAHSAMLMLHFHMTLHDAAVHLTGLLHAAHARNPTFIGKVIFMCDCRLRKEGVPDEERMAAQNAANPKFIPRQHLLQYAIDDAENGDFSELARLMEVVT
eukprot:scaffold285514_cov17-Tisochrysis_lutea.AAC.1